MSIRGKVNFSDESARRVLLDAIRSIDGVHRVEIVRWRPRRTDRQNRFYWPAFVQPFAEWIAERAGESPDEDAAHRVFKTTFLRVTQTNKHGEVMFLPSGDPMKRTRSTTELETEEFNIYLDQCGQLLVDLGVLKKMPDPDEYHEREAA